MYVLLMYRLWKILLSNMSRLETFGMTLVHHLFFTAMKTQNHKYFGVTILTFRGHVTSSVMWPSDSARALCYWWSMMTMILHGYGYMRPPRFWCHEFDHLGSCDVISHVTILIVICGFLLVVHCNYASILHRYRNIKPQSSICLCIKKFTAHASCHVTCK